jgi:hypothetical protein
MRFSQRVSGCVVVMGGLAWSWIACVSDDPVGGSTTGSPDSGTTQDAMMMMAQDSGGAADAGTSDAPMQECSTVSPSDNTAIPPPSGSPWVVETNDGAIAPTRVATDGISFGWEADAAMGTTSMLYRADLPQLAVGKKYEMSFDMAVSQATDGNACIVQYTAKDRSPMCIVVSRAQGTLKASVRSIEGLASSSGIVLTKISSRVRVILDAAGATVQVDGETASLVSAPLDVGSPV